LKFIEAEGDLAEEELDYMVHVMMVSPKISAKIQGSVGAMIGRIEALIRFCVHRE